MIDSPRLGEAFSTLITAKRLFSPVYNYMQIETPRLDEAYNTLPTP